MGSQRAEKVSYDEEEESEDRQHTEEEETYEEEEEDQSDASSVDNEILFMMDFRQSQVA